MAEEDVLQPGKWTKWMVDREGKSYKWYREIGDRYLHRLEAIEKGCSNGYNDRNHYHFKYRSTPANGPDMKNPILCSIKIKKKNIYDRATMIRNLKKAGINLDSNFKIEGT